MVNSTATISPGLLWQDLEQAAAKLAALPKPVVGFVCRPDMVMKVRRLASDEAHPLFGPVPVYEKRGQVEPFVIFYDHDDLRHYLAAKQIHTYGQESNIKRLHD